MNDDPAVAKWKEAQRAGARAARARLVRRILPGAIVALVFGGILGAIKWHEVARRRESQADMERDRATVVDPARIEQVKARLQTALDRASIADKERADVLTKARATLEPSHEGGACPIPVATMPYATLLGLTSFSRGDDAAAAPMATTRLRWALESIDRRVEDKGSQSAESLTQELEREADSLGEQAEAPVDFQFFVEEEAQPRLLGDGFVPGFVRGTLYAYDRKTRSVPCAAALRAVSSSSVSVVTKTNTPVFSPDDPGSKVRADLLRNLMTDAATQLVPVVAKRPPADAPPASAERPPETPGRLRK